MKSARPPRGQLFPEFVHIEHPNENNIIESVHAVKDEVHEPICFVSLNLLLLTETM